MHYPKKIYNWLSALGLQILLLSGLSAQQVEIPWNESYNHLTWSDFISHIENQYSVRFFYDTDSLPDFKMNVTGRVPGFINQLNGILQPYGHAATMDQDGNIFITRNLKIRTTIPHDFFKKPDIISSSDNLQMADAKNHRGALMSTNHAYAEQRITIGKLTNDNRPRATISGYVKSVNDNTPIIGVIIRIDGTSSAIMTDVSGFYSLNVAKGNQLLIAGSLETKEKKVNLKVLSDGRLDLTLEPRLVSLNAVVISADKNQIVKSVQMGYQRLTARDMKEIPLVMGEQDVIKVSLLLPGIQSVGEGSAGVNVRGSPTDENLFIINDIPVYNSSHLLGFFSTFNPDAIKDFTLYKSNIPANFGGRLASVFDIKTKQGNQNNFTANGGISPVTAKLTVEGPILKKRSSYMIGLRSTYSDWILKRIDDPDISNSDAQFADVVTDFSFDLNKNNGIRFSSYHSFDRINIIEKNKYDYANNGASLSWNHLIQEKNNFNVSLVYSRYDFTERNAEINIASYKDDFSLEHGELKAYLTLRPHNKHTVTAGFNSVLYLIHQGDIAPLNSESLVNSLHLENEKAVESGLFIADEWNASPKLTIVGGIRYNHYAYLGPQQVKTYAPGVEKSFKSIIDTSNYTNNQVIKTYGAPDVRFAVRYLIRDNLSVKAGFNQLKQYLFMLSNTIAVSPTDKWKLCDYHIKPMTGNQYSIGIYQTILNGKMDISAEAYYKDVRNLVEYKNGANLVVNELPETDVVQGDLKTYGVELMINKPKGRFNGWLNYTYARTFVTINGPLQEERINNGKSYPSNYDKPHALNLVANYKLSRRFSVSSNLVYSTGRPITYPVGFYYQNDIKIPLYSRRNEYRVPDYFRVDLSVKLEGNLVSKKFAHGTWIFSVYNLTGRRNAYSVFFRSEENVLRGYKLSVFGVPMVSLTYSFKLGNYAN